MSDATSQSGNGNGAGSGDGNGGGQGSGGDANQNQNNGGQQQQQQQTNSGNGSGADANIDLSKLEPAQLEKVLENPALWNLPRVKELREQAAEAKKLKDAQAAAEEKSLEEQKKFQELAEKRGQDLTAAQQRIQDLTIGQALTNKLAPLGVVDLDAALKLIDRSKISVDDNGTVTGVDEAIESLKTDKAYLFGNGNGGTQSLGTATNSNNNGSGGPAKFKRSQLRDAAFYQQHRDEILAAQKAGLIEDDITPAQQQR